MTSDTISTESHYKPFRYLCLNGSRVWKRKWGGWLRKEANQSNFIPSLLLHCKTYPSMVSVSFSFAEHLLAVEGREFWWPRKR